MNDDDEISEEDEAAAVADLMRNQNAARPDQAELRAILARLGVPRPDDLPFQDPEEAE